MAFDSPLEVAVRLKFVPATVCVRPLNVARPAVRVELTGEPVKVPVEVMLAVPEKSRSSFH